MKITAVEVRHEEGLIEELNRLASLPEKELKVIWSLDSSIAPLLKLLGYEKCKELWETKKCQYYEQVKGNIYNLYKLFYIPSKVFSVNWCNFYDLEQYFPDEDKEPEGLEEVQMLADRLAEALEIMSLEPSKLTSPVAIYEELIMKHLDIPNVYDMPREASEIAWLCSGKLWIENYQVGYWDKAYDYDIVSSFPTVVRDLIDIRDEYCEWLHSGYYVPEAIYGYAECEVTIYDDVQVSPIIYENEEGELTTPTGTWHTYLTKWELDFIVEHKIGEWVILNSWWCVPKTEYLAHPLQVVMNRLLQWKEHDNEVVKNLAKRMSVGVYGKFGEEWQDRFGPYFNPVYFAEVSTQVRLEVARFIYENELQDSLIHVSVDGVLVDKEIKL